MTVPAHRPSDYGFPIAQLGYLSPLLVVDAMHYEFYQAIPRGLVFVSYPLSIAEFTPAATLKAVERADEGISYLKQRGVSRVIFGGLPVSSLMGRQQMLRCMGQAQDSHGVAISSDFEDTLDALRHLGARRVAVGAKWKPPVMRAVADYLADAGFDVAGSCGSDFDAAGVARIDTVNSVGTALALGRQALNAFPDVDALVLGGGTWLAIPATSQLEEEFGKPVVSNMLASSWAAARTAGVPTATGLGCRLLDGPWPGASPSTS